MSVAVICSIYGEYDPPPVQPTQSIDAEWIFVTDKPTAVAGWKTVVEPREHMHPRLAAKVAKCLPSLYTDAETTVWLDGACKLLTRDSLFRIIKASEGAAIAQVPHPLRDDIYEEAHASYGMPKYKGQPVFEQVESYRDAGHPEHWGLWATGLIVRDHGGRDLDEFGDRWLTEQVRWTYQDQLSEPHIVRELGIDIHPLPFDLYNSGLFEFRPHAHGY